MDRFSRPTLVALASIVLGILAGITPSVGAAEPSASQPGEMSPVPPQRYQDQPGDGADLAAGTYLVDSIPGLSVTFTVPPGWYKGNVDFAAWEGDTNSSVGFHAPDNVYMDPCDPALGLRAPAIGPTVDDLVAALADMRGVVASVSRDAMLSGYTGKQLELTVDPALDCPELALWDQGAITVPGPGQGATDRLWILDVDGRRFVVLARTRAGASPQVETELLAVAESVRLDSGTAPSAP
jgi:hypothetical protein